MLSDPAVTLLSQAALGGMVALADSLFPFTRPACRSGAGPGLVSTALTLLSIPLSLSLHSRTTWLRLRLRRYSTLLPPQQHLAPLTLPPCLPPSLHPSYPPLVCPLRGRARWRGQLDQATSRSRLSSKAAQTAAGATAGTRLGTSTGCGPEQRRSFRPRRGSG